MIRRRSIETKKKPKHTHIKRFRTKDGDIIKIDTSKGSIGLFPGDRIIVPSPKRQRECVFVGMYHDTEHKKYKLMFIDLDTPESEQSNSFITYNKVPIGVETITRDTFITYTCCRELVDEYGDKERILVGMKAKHLKIISRPAVDSLHTITQLNPSVVV